jgi:hypothetical protein
MVTIPEQGFISSPWHANLQPKRACRDALQIYDRGIYATIACLYSCTQASGKTSAAQDAGEQSLFFLAA